MPARPPLVHVNSVCPQSDMKKPKTTVGLSVDFYGDLTPSRIIHGLRYLGVEFIEVTRSVFRETETVAKVLKNIRTALHLPLVHQDGWDFSCSGFQQQIDSTIEQIHRHREKLAIQHVIAHPPESESTAAAVDSSFDLLLHNLQRIELPVCLENVPCSDPDLFLRQVDRAQKFLGDLWAGICFDAAHYMVSNVAPVREFIRLRDRIGCVHLSDCDPDEDQHLPFGVGGSLPVEQLLRTIGKSGFRGYITLEIKPRSMAQVDDLIRSYLLTLRALHYGKYLRTRMRLTLLRPWLKKAVS